MALSFLSGRCRPSGWETREDLSKDLGSQPGRAGSWELCFHGSTSSSARGLPARRPLPGTSLCNWGRDLGVQRPGVEPTSATASSVTLAQLLSLSKPPSSHLQNGHTSHFSKFSRGFINIRHISCPAPCWHPDVVNCQAALVEALSSV